MSDSIQHECGIAFIRLRKGYVNYTRKFGSPLLPINKLYLLMEKQHNRGQDGAGAAVIKLNTQPGQPYIFSTRTMEKDPIAQIYRDIGLSYEREISQHLYSMADPNWVKDHVPFAGELLLGHLRYGTHGENDVSFCHPFVRESNWLTRNLVIAGNFNLTNTPELFDRLVDLGQHPRNQTDTNVILEKIAHYLDEENDRLVREYKAQGYDRRRISALIAEHLDVAEILRNAIRYFDGGYVIAGMFGHGAAFILRDPHGIRPAFYYKDDDLVTVASERPAIQTAFAQSAEYVHEIKPGCALIIDPQGGVREEQIVMNSAPAKCSFERIYFSRGTDRDIYQERKALGRNLGLSVLKAINYDMENTVFSFIPNTSEVAFLGLMESVRDWLVDMQQERLRRHPDMTQEEIRRMLSLQPRIEKIMNKDAKLRTFITNEKDRRDLVALVYDTTYGVVRRGTDTLVVVDDSIVRGTTLRTSILGILDHLGPRRIIVASSAPQIRYPDCYGIDMSKLKNFIAFEAMLALVEESGHTDRLKDVYEACKAAEQHPAQPCRNEVQCLYDMFSDEAISAKIAEKLRPPGLKAELQVIYQRIEDLHRACPNHRGDWYFTGNYPTVGGNRVVNRSFVLFMERSDKRAY